jgi:hypothetical protein
MIADLQKASIASDMACHISDSSFCIVLHPAMSANVESSSTQHDGVTQNWMKATIQPGYPFYAIH